MKGKILILSALMVLNFPCFAQSDLVLYDAENDRVGTVIYIDVGSPGGYTTSIYTPDGYAIKVNPLTGVVNPSEEIYYASADCNGQAYLPLDPGIESWGRWGGLIFYVNQSDVQHARIEWAPPVVAIGTIFSGGVCWRNDDCGGSSRICSADEYVPVEIVNDAQYGLGDLGVPSGRFGFLPPLTPRVENSDGIFCDSFESCQTQ